MKKVLLGGLVVTIIYLTTIGIYFLLNGNPIAKEIAIVHSKYFIIEKYNVNMEDIKVNFSKYHIKEGVFRITLNNLNTNKSYHISAKIGPKNELVWLVDDTA